MHNPPHPSTSDRPLRLHRLLPLAALVLLGVVIARAVHDEPQRAAAPSATKPPAAAAHEFGPGRVTLPSGWRRLDRTGDVVTWSDAARDDSVTVASVEASAAPLASIVAEVARTARSEDPTARTSAPRELTLGAAPRADSAIVLPMVVAGPEGTPMHVRQIWRRDSRSGRDVVATWTSTDDVWDLTAEASIPEADV